MELNAHDMIRIHDASYLVSDIPAPGWVSAALHRTPYVVVRRELSRDDMIPVGVRGNTRGERFAAHIPLHAIIERTTPESLTSESIWTAHTRFQQIEAIRILEVIKPLFTSLNLQWGPSGSVGFELASGQPTVNNRSDLDLIIRSEQLPSLEVARWILDDLAQLCVRTDVLIEMPMGAIALTEYSQGNSLVLLRTQSGPCLVSVNSLVQLAELVEEVSY